MLFEWSGPLRLLLLVVVVQRSRAIKGNWALNLSGIRRRFVSLPRRDSKDSAVKNHHLANLLPFQSLANCVRFLIMLAGFGFNFGITSLRNLPPPRYNPLNRPLCVHKN